MLDTRWNIYSANIAKLSLENCSLMEDKETMDVYVTNLMASTDMGINKDTRLEIIFAVMSYRIASNYTSKHTILVLNNILNGNKSLLKLFNDNVIGPAREKQTNQNVRICAFIKIDNYF